MESYIAATFNTLMLLVALAVVLCVVLVIVLNIKKDIYKDGFREGFGAHKNLLLSSSYWFSEHPPTASLLRNIVEDAGDTYTIRETWRKALSEYNQQFIKELTVCEKASWYTSLDRSFNMKDAENQEKFHDKND